jgi:hypothetical protein
MSVHAFRAPTEINVRFVNSPINPSAWARAEWMGVGYLTYEGGRFPPSLGLLFHNAAYGRRIFRAWRARFGPDGADVALRVAIIEGPTVGYLPGYFVHLGADPEWAAAQEPAGPPATAGSEPVSGYMVHRVTPPSGADFLSAFKADLARHGRYTLIPILWGGCRFEPVPDLAVGMTRVQFRSATEVGANDVDRVCFSRRPVPSPDPMAGSGTSEKPQTRRSVDVGLVA